MIDTTTWAAELRLRLRIAREARGLSWIAAARASGVPTPGKIESGSARFLYLDQVLHLCRVYRVSFEALAVGWRGWKDGAPPPTVDEKLDIETIMWDVRASIRSLRGDRGTPQVARDAWGKPSHQSTLARWESGEYQRMDIERLFKLADYYNITLTALVGRSRA